MKNLFYSICIIAFILLYGCGEKADEMKKAMEVMQKAPQMANNMEKDTKAAEQRKLERAKRGDTLAMHYTELQKYLPESVEGYTAEAPNGETTNAGGFSLSNAKRNFVKKNADGSNLNVTIELMDYNQAEPMFTGITALWAMGISVENNEKLEKTFNPGVEFVNAFESFDKVNKHAEVDYAIGWRFFLKITADKQTNCDFVKKIASSMKLKELASK